ncbi:hypothetical protein TYRP_018349 [Tyrophagus putrescentiae]|nr:hypothetical protein TYRP_018349 [Tyrophagus putrescentiae]
MNLLNELMENRLKFSLENGLAVAGSVRGRWRLRRLRQRLLMFRLALLRLLLLRCRRRPQFGGQVTDGDY